MIRDGILGTSFDTPFIFAAVNAEEVWWFRQKDGSTKKFLYKNE